MAATGGVRDELLGLLERLRTDSDELRRLLQALDAAARQPDDGDPEEKAQFADREAFLRMKEALLAEYRGMFVAFANGQLVAAHRSLSELLQRLQAQSIQADVYIERVEEEAFLDPPEFECSGVHEIYDAAESLP